MNLVVKVMNKLLSTNLRTKLIIAILCSSIFPLLLLGFFSYKYISNILQEEISSNELERLRSINEQFTYFLKDIEQMSFFFYKSEQVNTILKKDPDRSTEEKYDDYIQVNDLFDTVLGVKEWDVNIYLIGLNNDRYFSNNYLPATYHKARESWGALRKANTANGAMIWDTAYSFHSFNNLKDEDIALTAGRLIVDPTNHQKLGYIMVDVNKSELSSLYEKKSNFSNEQFFMLDHHGNLIFSQAGDNQVGIKPDVDFLERVMNGDSGYFNLSWEGERSILAYHTADYSGFKSISITPLSIIQDRNNLIRKLTFNFALIGIIISAWLAYFLSRTITMPLYKLMSLMREVEKGNLDVRFDSKYYDDIGIFGRRFNNMLRELKIRIQDSYEKQVRLKDSELKALRAQINPHFLYNTLDSVNWLARLKGAEEISTIVVSLSDILRYSINSGDDLVSIKEDITQLKKYLTIQEFRYRDKFNVHLSVDQTIENKLIPSLLLQPLVENAIVHGIENKVDKGNIYIDISDHRDRIKFVISDDGVGMDEHTLSIVNQPLDEQVSISELGIGIENVRKRMFLYYSDEYEWHLHSTLNKGTTVTFIIPYLEREEDEDV